MTKIHEKLGRYTTNRYARNTIVLLFYIIISLISIRYLLNGIIGMRHDWVLPYLPSQISSFINSEFQTWSDIFGYGFIRRNLFFYKLFLKLLSVLTSSNPIFFSILTITSLLSMSGFFMYIFAKRYLISFSGGTLAGFSYMLTPLVFNNFVAGYTGFIFSYCLTPIVLLLFFLGVERKQINWKLIIASSLVYGMSFAQQQFILFIPSMIVLWLIFLSFKRKRIDLFHLVSFFVFICIGVLMHLFWILPSYINSNTDFLRIGALGYHALVNVPEISQAIIMTGWGHSYDYSNLLNNEIISISSIFFLYLILILSLSSIFFKTHLIKKVYLIVLLLIGLLFGTGSNPPGGHIFEIMYTNVPFFRIFRDPYYFTFFISFSFSLLLGFFAIGFYKIVNKKFKKPILIKMASFSLVFVFIFLSSGPVLSGNFSNQIQNIEYPVDYQKVYNKLSNEPDIYRILYIPSFQPIKIDENEYPGIDLMIRFSPKPTFPQHVDTTNRLNRFHEYSILSLRTGYNIENLLNVTSTKYILDRENFESWYWKYIPGDEENWEKKEYNESTLSGRIVYNSNNLTLYSRDYNDFFQITKPIIGFGDLNLIRSIPNNALGNISIIFDSDIPLIIDEFQNDLFLTNDASGFEKSKLFIQNFDDIKRLQTEKLKPNDGWAYDITTWRKHFKITSDQIINSVNTIQTSKPNEKINTEFNIEKDGAYFLFVRIFNNVDGGDLKFSFNDDISIINTKDKINHFIWKNIGQFDLKKGNYQLTIENVDGFNAISYVSILPSSEYSNFLTDFHRDIDNNFIYVLDGENNFYLDNKYKIEKETSRPINSINLESSGLAWREIKIDRSDEYVIGVKGLGDFEILIDEYNFNFNSNKFGYNYFGPISLSDEIHNVTIKPFKDSDSLIETFENGTNNWGNPSNAFAKEISSDSYTGKYSLKLSTSSNKNLTWSWFRSNPIDVNPGQKCRIITHMKYENVKQSHIPIDGYNLSMGKWEQILQIPAGKNGDSEWKKYDLAFQIPRNITKLRVVLNAGWTLNNSNGPSTTWFDDIQIYPYNKGYFDNIWLFPSSRANTIDDLFIVDVNAKINNYKKISPTKYELSINSSEKFLLSFSESYDKQWIAEISKNSKIEHIEPIPLYGCINGYVINKTGDYKLILKYMPQEIFDSGLILSSVTILLCLIFIIYGFRKNILNAFMRWKNVKKRHK